MALQALLDEETLECEKTAVAQETCDVLPIDTKTPALFLPHEDLLGQIFEAPGEIGRKLYRADLGTMDPVALAELLQMFMMTLQLCETLSEAKRWFSTPSPLLGGEIPAQLIDSGQGRESVREVLHGALLGEFELQLR